MKTIFSVFIFLGTIFYIQFNLFHWRELSSEIKSNLIVSKLGEHVVNDITIKIKWKDSLSNNPNLGYLGGIKMLEIHLQGKRINQFHNLKDEIGLGEFLFEFYDFNLDGILDFRIRRECSKNCYYDYYLFNNESNKFQHVKGWDYIRIQKVDRENKLIMTQPNGMEDNREIYSVKGVKLIKK